MKYKVLIKNCSDPSRAKSIAEEIARWSGSSVDVVYGVITQKPVCIKREADQAGAQKLKAQFEAIGAQVELVSLGTDQPAAAMHQTMKSSPASQMSQAVNANDDDDDDDQETPGRLRSDSEMLELTRKRNDIFVIERERKSRIIQLVCFVLAILVGIRLSTLEVIKVATDFYEKLPEERTAKFVKASELPATLQEKKPEEKKEQKQEEIKSDAKKLTPSKRQSSGGGGMSGGGGDPRARVTQKGVLGIISGQIKGKAVASADIFGKGGFATGIDGILQGVGGLKSGGGGGVGRKGVAGIGYGSGYGSGFGGGGGSGGVDDLIGSLMGGDQGGGLALDLKKRGALKISAPDFVSGAALTGGRSKASIMRVVMQNLAALRYAYNKRLREKPGLNGKITCKFAIDEFGKVIYCEVVETTISDQELETTVVDKIKRWVFEKIDKPGDVTEVIYPFVFSQ